MAETLTGTARDSIGSVCQVREAVDGDAVDGVHPQLVAAPTDTAQVSEVMRATQAHGLRVVARGAGTKLTWGLPPTGVDVLLDLAGMGRVLDHQAGDLIAEAQAGTPLRDLQSTCAEQGQRLVVDEMVPGATVGGMLAANSSGPQRMLAGTARDLLIGVTMVRADGVVAKAGGRVVKNVAGYDLGKLLIGSLGTLGIITEAVFRLHPVPEVSRWVEVPVTGAEEAHRLAHAVVHAQAVPAAVEVDLTPDGLGTLAVQLGGREAAVEQRARTVAALLGADAAVGETEPAGWATYPWGQGEVGLKLTCVLSGLRDVLGEATAAGLSVRGSAGTGVLYAALPASAADEAAAALDRVRTACTRHGGAAVVVQAPREVKEAVDVWGPVSALDLMRRVKDQFDPDHRLAPGRFVGGI